MTLDESPPKLRVLLVDDDDVDRMIVRRAVARHGSELEVVETASIGSGLALATSEVFDCAIVDFHLSDGTALDFIGRILETNRGLPVVVLTGHSDPDTAVRALKEGAQDYLVKGTVDGPTILRALRHAIERQRVVDLKHRLLHADRLAAVGQLAAGVAHEVNNPLTYLLANSTQLAANMQGIEQALKQLRIIFPSLGSAAPSMDGSTPASGPFEPSDILQLVQESREMLEENLSGLHRIREIIKDLKVFSRKEPSAHEQLSVNDVLATVCNLAFNEVRHRARLVKDLKPLPRIVADRGRLVQLFTHLIMNAAQSIAPGNAAAQLIRISSEAQLAHVIITIEDTGHGIAKEHLPRVFEPFFTTRSRDVATGLGLPLCLEIAQRHGGDIQVKSEVGVGTQVVVQFPVSAPQVAESQRSDAPPSERLHRRARVLIIDDEELVCRSYKRVLGPFHDVVIACGGKQALDLLERDTRFDVIICDLMMPEVDGLLVYEQLRKSESPLLSRIVFASGGVFSNRARTFMSAIHNVCLEKPLTHDMLLTVVAEVATEHASRRDV